jgi:ABC-2 type transport system permease protein
VSAAWLIATKDLRQRARDRSLFILAFVAPLALAFVFSTVFGGLDDASDRISFSYGLVDLDGGDLASGFGDTLTELEDTGLIEVTVYADTAAARDAVNDGDISAAFVLPAGLSNSFATGTPAQVAVIGSVDARIATAVATSIARSYMTRTSTAALAGITAAAVGAIPPDQIGDIAEAVGAGTPLAELATIETDSAALDLTTTMVAGLSVFFVFFVSGTAVSGVLEERKAGTLPRLLVSPAARSAILLGKATAAIIAGVVALVSLMIISTFVMGAEWGNPAGAVLLATAAVLAATGIMSLVGGLARTSEQAGNLQAIVAVSMAMLGGSFGLVAPSGDSLWAQLSLLTPNQWFLRGVGELVTGTFADVLPAVGALLAMAVVTGTVAASLAGRVLRP